LLHCNKKRLHSLKKPLYFSYVAVQQFRAEQQFGVRFDGCGLPLLLNLNTAFYCFHFYNFWRYIMLTVEQIMAANKANFETMFGLTHKAFEGIEKLIELNMQATKAALAETANHAQAVMGAKDAQEFMALQAALAQPLAEKTAAYSRHLYDIASSAGTDLGKSIEGQAADAQRKFMGLVDNAARNAPAGSETSVAVMKSAVAAANNAFESMQKAVKQASDMAESNFNNVAAQAASATRTAVKKR
jgi:phasin family protein